MRILLWCLGIVAIAAFGTAGLAMWGIFHPKNLYSSDQLAPFLTATEVELYSVNPERMDYGEDPHAPDAPEPKRMKTPFGDFHDYPVLGICKITAAAELEAVRKAVKALDAAGRQWSGGIVMCFNPRHGLRVRSGGRTCDLLICYECSAAHIYRDDAEDGILFFSLPQGTPSPSPEDLNSLLKAHAVALPKKHKQR
ncbi:MAG: hypothetical protein NTY98_05945 [Verrucomicrobia bacterium]|nr:hypothetical protein [Verrucomicrobiota bacterium]